MIQSLIDMVASSAIPIALFCLGASLQFSKATMSYAELAWMTTAKLFIHPAITWGTFVGLGVDDKVWMITTVVLTALPTGALVHVVAFKYRFFEKETSQIIVLSTVLSLLSVSLWLYLLL